MRRPHEPHQSALSPGLQQQPEKGFDGVHITPDELYRLHADALRLTTTPTEAVASLFPGAYRAIFHGSGLEFDEVRAYQWGDDFRSIDWRVSARSGQLHTKLFHEEREKTLYLLLDRSPSMHFGSRIQFKWVLAARIAAVFGWLACDNGDRIGAVVAGDSPRSRFQPAGMGETALIRVFKLFAKPAATLTPSRSRINDGLHHLLQTVKRHAQILIVSDFLNLDNDTLKLLAHLSKLNDVAVVKIHDPLEAELPQHGYYPITNGTKVKFINSGNKKFLQAYKENFHTHQQVLLNHCKKYRITFMSLCTDELLIEGLRKAIRSGFASIYRKPDND